MRRYNKAYTEASTLKAGFLSNVMTAKTRPKMISFCCNSQTDWIWPSFWIFTVKARIQWSKGEKRMKRKAIFRWNE